ncbi:S-adenosylmethionine-dependent methyltransferase KNAG_0M01850 [Huiozyma naganishii CBS 8797]|uniref:carnosine N-methyltransferase n=1 Tax=Huiozyma naganishii (strain ATCC MYA-139 / BCRC 22969 / CBS 8797 / KCTC 17520 / NBRC 10181 / NCYC 3082 / Yp74L-3) TaxID=1071383 RepID=J7RSZ0_HUIN7|nr:hypothetical protein KNAG_0M01850 [Kazachstania naganishii CBS 8797]CCK73038.1 hypothetical protein KNAG_0M01850 [Kazachstania naganishii CBS 8797]
MNSLFLQAILTFNIEQPAGFAARDIETWPSPSELDKIEVVSILTQINREWSGECDGERVYLRERLKKCLDHVDISVRNKGLLEVLNPGCGTGRLLVDAALEGVAVCGSDISIHMMLVANYMLNGGLQMHEWEIYPFVHAFSHWQNRECQLRAVKVPNLNLCNILSKYGRMEMGYVSFVNGYGPNVGIRYSSEYKFNPDIEVSRAAAKNKFDFVVTNFFLDTGSNMLSYLQTIQHCLKPGGIWLNYGPLLYHFKSEDETEAVFDISIPGGEIINQHGEVPMSGLELSVEDIVRIATQRLGFTILEREDGIVSGYGSPLGNNGLPGYKCHYWAMQLSQ